ncbi:MAG: carbon-nitrogen hydrolase family protein [Hyphomicrobiaceae bacterium]|nr:carbon-nitrogen hydrolase family protein [Hyphomicrobiaceae bacterium]
MGKKPESFRAALVQLRSESVVEKNLEAAEAAVRTAAGDGAQYVQTPENTSLMVLKTRALFEKTGPEEDNPAVERFSGLAKELGIWLHIGSVAIQLSDKKVANRSFLYTPRGDIAARYDKIHMFDVDLPNGETYRESKNYQPGHRAVIAELPWGKFGLTTCYDLRFPALYRSLAQAGAQFVSVPSAFTEQTGKAHWHVLLRARAIENGVYVFAAAQGGAHDMGRSTYGHSLIISPWGEIIAEAGTEPDVIFAEIDPVQVAEARTRIPSLRHDRDFKSPSDAEVVAVKEAS